MEMSFPRRASARIPAPAFMDGPCVLRECVIPGLGTIPALLWHDGTGSFLSGGCTVNERRSSRPGISIILPRAQNGEFQVGSGAFCCSPAPARLRFVSPFPKHSSLHSLESEPGARDELGSSRSSEMDFWDLRIPNSRWSTQSWAAEVSRVPGSLQAAAIPVFPDNVTRIFQAGALLW